MTGKVAIVTGGARGLGGAAGSALAREGASVVVAGILVDEGHAKVHEITVAGGGARFAHLDVRDADAWARVVDECVEAYGGVDVLVNNAGINLPRTIEDANLDEFKRVMDINLYGSFLGIKAALPALIARGRGIDRQRVVQLDRDDRAHHHVLRGEQGCAGEPHQDDGRAARDQGLPDPGELDPSRPPLDRDARGSCGCADAAYPEDARDGPPRPIRQTGGVRTPRRLPRLGREQLHHGLRVLHRRRAHPRLIASESGEE